MHHQKPSGSNVADPAPDHAEQRPAHTDFHVQERLFQERLRAPFSNVLSEPMPDRFARLLDRLAGSQK
jgi:hypothetical protein